MSIRCRLRAVVTSKVLTSAVGQLGYVGVLHLQAGGLLPESILYFAREHLAHTP